MSWLYKQSTGQLFSPEAACVGVGYSGSGEGKNNPDMQNVPDVGPLPRGEYEMEVITDESGCACEYEHKLPPVLRLIPSQENEMFGRSGCLMHGDSIIAPGTASKGCVIQSHAVRELCAASLDKLLEVVR